jgi:hypothetical protein
VVGTGDEDPLASIALALAIFAFALQIVFFIVQLRIASDQDRRSAELFRDTSAVLTKIDERSSATVEVIREQFGFVLSHALGVPLDADTGSDETEPDSVIAEETNAETSDEPITQDQLEAAVTRAVRTSLGPDLLTRWQEISRPRPPTASEAARESRRRIAEFEQEVGRVLSGALAGRPSATVVRQASVSGESGRFDVDFLVEDEGARGIVEVKTWRGAVPSGVVRRTAERVRAVQDALNATSVLVIPEQESEERVARLRRQAEPVPIVTIDEFAQLLARGWPRESEPPRSNPDDS